MRTNFRWMAAIMGLLGATSLGSPGAAQENLSVHEAEIIRRGNHCETTGVHGDSVDDRLAAALAPPSDDSHKWFITVITRAGCEPCAKLIRDLNGTELRAWHVDANDKTAWAHLNVVSADDSRNAWRLANVKFRAVPCVIVQPPKSGRFGENSVIAVQLEGYAGDPKKFSQLIRSKLREYLATCEPQETGAGQTVSIPPPPDCTGATLEELAAACPEATTAWLLDMRNAGASAATAKQLWDREHKVDVPAVPSVSGPSVPAVSDKRPMHSSSSLSATILAILLSVNGLHFAMKLWEWYRTSLRASRRSPLIPDEIQQAIAVLLEARIAKNPSPTSVPS